MSRLTKAQKNQLIEWAAAGLQSDEINRLARDFSEPFQVNREQVRYYRATRGVQLRELAEAAEYDALTTGLSQRAERVRRLQMLAGLLEDDLFNGGHWVTDVKIAGGEMVEVERFNGSEVEQYRGVLDDIAKEMGERNKTVVMGDKDHPVELVQVYVPDNGRGGPGRGGERA